MNSRYLYAIILCAVCIATTQHASDAWKKLDGEQSYTSAEEYFALANTYFNKKNWQAADDEYYSRLTDPAVLACTKEEAQQARDNWQECKEKLK